jgi:hypothetical protein
MNLEIFRQIFEKYSNITFRENLSKGSRICSIRTDGPTDRQTETDDRRFCNFANAPKNPSTVTTRWYSRPLCVILPSAYTVLSLVLPQRSSINVCRMWLHYAVHRNAYISTEIFARISKLYILHLVHTEFYSLALPYRKSPTRKYSIGYGDTLIFSIIAKGHRISWSEDLVLSNISYVTTPWA